MFRASRGHEPAPQLNAGQLRGLSPGVGPRRDSPTRGARQGERVGVELTASHSSVWREETAVLSRPEQNHYNDLFTNLWENKAHSSARDARSTPFPCGIQVKHSHCLRFPCRHLGSGPAWTHSKCAAQSQARQSHPGGSSSRGSDGASGARTAASSAPGGRALGTLARP